MLLLLDEGTAAAEAMSMSYGLSKTKAMPFLSQKPAIPRPSKSCKPVLDPWALM
jgi:glycine cleavage system pyridoxal-binding protein P